MVEGRCTDGTHAVPRVTSINLGACKYKPKLNRGWRLPPFGPDPMSMKWGTTSARYADSSLKPLSLCLTEETMYTHAPNYESVSILGNLETHS